MQFYCTPKIKSDKVLHSDKKTNVCSERHVCRFFNLNALKEKIEVAGETMDSLF